MKIGQVFQRSATDGAVGLVCLRFELVQGGGAAAPGANPEELARGELVEETGLSADREEQIGQLFPLYGTATQSYRIPPPPACRKGCPGSVEELDLVVKSFTVDKVEGMILCQVSCVMPQRPCRSRSCAVCSCRAYHRVATISGRFWLRYGTFSRFLVCLCFSLRTFICTA